MIHVLYSNNTRDSGFFGYDDCPFETFKPEWYEHVASFEDPTTDGAEDLTDMRLDNIWRAMNVVNGNEVPIKIKKRSMMVGDMIVAKLCKVHRSQDGYPKIVGHVWKAYGVTPGGFIEINEEGAKALGEKVTRNPVFQLGAVLT